MIKRQYEYTDMVNLNLQQWPYSCINAGEGKRSDRETTPEPERWLRKGIETKEYIKKIVKDNGLMPPGESDDRHDAKMKRIADVNLIPLKVASSHSDYWQLYSWRARTLVLRLPTFNWADEPYAQSLQELIRYLLQVYPSGLYDNLLLDVRQNMGGVACMGLWLSLFLRQLNSPPIWNVQRKTPMFGQYLAPSSFGSEVWWNNAGWYKNNGTAVSKLYAAKNTQIPGVTGSYTQMSTE